ncbi:MAG TPA: TRAM domain-containing protein [Elusimicrobiota bacterium]|nr:TRAM domain-containing protein [Elusimicrobiota bacterium]
MYTWLFRLGVVVACPAIVYFAKIAPNAAGIGIGVGVGLLIVLIEYLVAEINLLTIMGGALGATVGIIVARLVDFGIYQIGNDNLNQVWERYSALRFFAFGVLGLVIAVRKFPELDDLDKDLLKMGKKRGANIKILDTNVIIDGRVADVVETHFLSGTLVVPRFVLTEMHRLADSEDPLKRARGRRGLDVLARLQENVAVPVKILDKDVPDVREIEGKVVKLAREMGAKIVTTDFNVNKVASLEGVICLNVNDLSTSLKTVVLPGEPMSVFVMKDGKEREQGVGYLDDGTMVVVEDGKRAIGKRVEAVVTSIHQTSNGRMIFAKARPERAPVV